MVRVTPAESQQKWDFKKIEQHLIQAGCSWSDELHQSLLKTFDEATANTLMNTYGHIFPSAYTDSFSPKLAVCDITHLEALSDGKPFVLHFYQDPSRSIRPIPFKTFSAQYAYSSV